VLLHYLKTPLGRLEYLLLLLLFFLLLFFLLLSIELSR
jgi:hypothetical protein